MVTATKTTDKPPATNAAATSTTARSGAVLRLLGTHWETPSLDGAGWVETPFDLDPKETGFVALHLWNVGDAGGPPVPDRFFVDMGTRECQLESVRIADRYIAPAIAASREAGMPVFHVEPPSIALQYDSARYLLEAEELEPRRAKAGPERPLEANPGWIRERAERSHGRRYMEWEGWEPGRMRILASCDAEPGDQVVVTGRQFDRILREGGIKNLVYTGFATNMCILQSAAATQEMLRYGYRIFLIREATLAVEYPDTFAERLMTRAALKYFELKVGDTIGFDPYLAACRAIAGAGRPVRPSAAQS
ncbi:MAG: cysteine hydrolase family protein [Chloroflexota bacterium]